MVPVNTLRVLLEVSKDKGVNLIGCCPDDVLGLVIKPEYSWVIDCEYVHLNPLETSNEYDLYLLVGDKQEVDKWVSNRKEGEAMLKLFQQYGQETVLSWDSDTLEKKIEEVSKNKEIHMSDNQQFYVQANFPNDGWKSVFNVPFEEAQAYEALYYGKRDNNDLTYRLVNSVTNEVISESDAIESYLISVASQE